jgi:hypothetical protein
MNTNYYQEWMTDEELIRAYESDSDPAIRRLVRIALESGFDIEIPVESQATTLQEYIDELKENARYANQEWELCQKDLSEATAKADKLSVRTVPQLIQDLSNMVKQEQANNRRLQQEAADAKKREEEALHKMNMWAILNN